MASPYADKQSIYKRLELLDRIINPHNDQFSPCEKEHPLCVERDKLLKEYWEYMSYENWFKNKSAMRQKA